MREFFPIRSLSKLVYYLHTPNLISTFIKHALVFIAEDNDFLVCFPVSLLSDKWRFSVHTLKYYIPILKTVSL